MDTRDLLILGASGFLGPHLVRAASAAGWRVRAAVHRPGAWPTPDPPELFPWEAERPGELARLLDRTRPSAVVLATALAQVEACEAEPERAWRLNAALPEEAAGLCLARGLRLVHLSTDLVFGARPPRGRPPGQAGRGYDELDPPAPTSLYGRTKASGEERLLAAFPAALVVRLPLLYGDSLGRGLGASDQILAALERGERPVLFTDEWRTPLEAGNAARAVVELVGQDLGGRLHVAGPERLSRHELGLLLLEARGLPPGARAERLRPARRAELGLAELRPRDVSLDTTRACARLATPLLAPRAALASAFP